MKIRHNLSFVAGVLPGTYTISLADGDRRCWEEVVKKISVSEDVKNINFKQTGYNVQVRTATCMKLA
jgi:hypothetical protein